MKISEAFEKLEIPPNSNLEEVQSAYRTLSKIWHPDRFTVGSAAQKKAEIKQRELNEAFEILKKAYESGYESSGDTTEDKPDGKSVETPPRVFDAVYMGGDPRIDKKRIPCQVILTRDVFAINFGEDKYVLYPKEDIQFMAQGSGQVLSKTPIKTPQVPDAKPNVIHISFKDPEEVVSPFLVELKLQNDYFAKVLKKYIWQYYGLKRQAPVQKTPSSPIKSSSELNEDSEAPDNKNPQSEKTKIAPLVIIGGIIVFIFFLAIIDSNPDGKIASNPDEKQTSSATIVKFQAPPDTHIFTKGCFGVWTIPNNPTSGQDYKVVIAIYLPRNVKQYRSYDLTISIGSDGYRQILFDKKKQGYYFIPVKNRVARITATVPGGSSQTNDVLRIHSKMLNETQEIKLWHQ